MSQNSKAKRDKRKKQQPKRPINRLNAQQPVQNHAVLTNEEGQVVAAIGLQGTEWHLANVQEKEGRKVNLEYSTQLQQLIDDLAADEGKTADEYLAQLVSEFEGVEGEEGEEGEDAETAADAGDDAKVADEAGTDAAAVAAPAASDDKPQA